MADITYLLQILFNSLVNTSVYVLVALGLTLMFGVLQIPNFAHGQTYAIGAFTALVLTRAGVPFWGGLIGAMIVTAIVGVAIDRLAFNPVKSRTTQETSLLLVAFAVFEILGSVLEILFGAGNHSIAFPISGAIMAGGLILTYDRLVLIGVSAILVLGLHFLLSRSRSGKAMRALSEDRTKATIVGISPRKISMLTFATGSVLAGAAGALIGGVYGLSAFMGLDVILNAFVIVVVGGMGSILGATIAGLIIGISEGLVTGYLSAEFSRVVAFTILFIFLIYRPEGIYGESVEREG